MADLFQRYCAVTVGTLRIDGLRIQFKIHKSIRPEPNTAEITITNLSEQSRKQMQSSNVVVALEAGYARPTPQQGFQQSTVQRLFLGDVRQLGGITHKKTETEWQTQIKAGDGEATFKAAKVNQKFAKGTAKSDVLKAIAKTMQVDAKDAVAKIGSQGFWAASEQFARGIVLSGSSQKALSDVLGTRGSSWSIQDGVLQILKSGETLGSQKTAPVFSAESGLVGSPELGEDGYLKAKVLLHPQIVPGWMIVLYSLQFKGAFRVESVNHSGDTWGQDWYSELEVKPV